MPTPSERTQSAAEATKTAAAEVIPLATAAVKAATSAKEAPTDPLLAKAALDSATRVKEAATAAADQAADAAKLAKEAAAGAMTYHSVLLFLTAFLTFCLGIIAAVVSNLDKFDAVRGRVVGPLLVYTALAALAGTACALFTQAASKGNPRQPFGGAVPWITLVAVGMLGICMAVAATRLGTTLVCPSRAFPSAITYGLGFGQC